jgi:hypothetical protein
MTIKKLCRDSAYFKKIEEILSDPDNKSCLNCIHFKISEQQTPVKYAADYTNLKFKCNFGNRFNHDNGGIYLKFFMDSKDIRTLEHGCFNSDSNINYGGGNGDL